MPPQPGEGSTYIWSQPTPGGSKEVKYDWKGYDAATHLATKIAQQAPDVFDQLGEILGASGEYRNKALQQAWDIAQLNERGANQRASIGASASKYSADASTKNARIAADTQRYGYDTQAQTAREKLALDTELGRGQLGLSALELPAKYRGPEDYFQQSDILRGMSGRQDIPVFVQSLINGGYVPGFAPSSATPNGFNLQGVVNTITGQSGGNANGGGAAEGQNGSALQAIRGLAQRGFQNIQPSMLEKLTPSELGLLKSGVEYSGDGGPAYNFDDLMRIRSLNAIGQGNAQAA